MENLEKRNFFVSRFADKASAAQYLIEAVGSMSVGMGGSVTMQELDIYDRLCARGDTYWHMTQPNYPPEIMANANAAQVYMLSANGVSESGQIINIDGKCNRVSRMCYGPERVYIVIGVNKIAPTDEMALWRARNIASPKNCRRLEKNTPCATGELKCHDCNHPERICRAFVTLERAPADIGRFEIVIVDEALGF